MIGATLTLPGIAGIVLTIGMAVDANVLVFERIKEELNKNNKFRGTGKEIRDFIHISDMTRLIYHFIKKDFKGKSIINCGSGKGKKINEVIKLIIAEFGFKVAPIFDKKKDIKSIKRIWHEVGWISPNEFNYLEDWIKNSDGLVSEINGHDILHLRRNIIQFNKKKINKPSITICHTIKGKGFYFAENNPNWHHKNELTEKEIKELNYCLK